MFNATRGEMKFFDRVLKNKKIYCLGCNGMYKAEDIKYAKNGVGLCTRCISNMKFTKRNDTFEGTEGVEFVVAPLFYCGACRTLIKDLKFSDVRANAEILGQIIEEYMSGFDIFKEYDVIVPVPLSKERLKERGFNQSEYAAEYLSKSTGIAVDASILGRIRNTERQSLMNAMQRQVNVKGAFEATERAEGLKIVLVDDIYTSGNTIKACADALKVMGAEKVCAFTYAVREPKKVSRIYDY